MSESSLIAAAEREERRELLELVRELHGALLAARPAVVAAHGAAAALELERTALRYGGALDRLDAAIGAAQAIV